jgi:hypothetical protein
LKNGWAQDADVIARAAVRAGFKASVSKDSELKVWNVEQKEILALGREALVRRSGGNGVCEF